MFNIEPFTGTESVEYFNERKNMKPFIRRLLNFWRRLFDHRSAKTLNNEQKEYYVIRSNDENIPL